MDATQGDNAIDDIDELFHYGKDLEFDERELGQIEMLEQYRSDLVAAADEIFGVHGETSGPKPRLEVDDDFDIDKFEAELDAEIAEIAGFGGGTSLRPAKS